MARAASSRGAAYHLCALDGSVKAVLLSQQRLAHQGGMAQICHQLPLERVMHF
jgi:hypothetical protein